MIRDTENYGPEIVDGKERAERRLIQWRDHFLRQLIESSTGRLVVTKSYFDGYEAKELQPLLSECGVGVRIICTKTASKGLGARYPVYMVLTDTYCSKAESELPPVHYGTKDGYETLVSDTKFDVPK